MPASLESECWPYGDSRHAHADIVSGNKHLHLVLLSPQVLGRYRGLECLSLAASLPNTQGSMILARVLRGLTCRPSAQGDRCMIANPGKNRELWVQGRESARGGLECAWGWVGERAPPCGAWAARETQISGYTLVCHREGSQLCRLGRTYVHVGNTCVDFGMKHTVHVITDCGHSFAMR